jgi:long-subunit acyl-CoA synthetase (AMP-forming)
MFSKYLRDPEATANAHDEEGYFKTGDSGFFQHSRGALRKLI